MGTTHELTAKRPFILSEAADERMTLRQTSLRRICEAQRSSVIGDVVVQHKAVDVRDEAEGNLREQEGKRDASPLPCAAESRAFRRSGGGSARRSTRR